MNDPEKQSLNVMMSAVNSMPPSLDALHCLLVSKVSVGVNTDTPGLCWEILRDIAPDLTAHLPALTTAVRNERNWARLPILASYPLPPVLSPETVGWRTELVAVWEKRLKAVRGALDNSLDISKWDWEWEYEYRSCLRGLTWVDHCGVPPGLICRSVLPILLDEACYVAKRLDGCWPPPWDWYRELVYGQLECLSALAGWRPGPNIMTDFATLNEWKDFWLEMYQRGHRDIPCNHSADPIIIKGIAAKALLNLLESGEKEETGILSGMEALLLQSLTMALDVAEKIAEHNYLNKYQNNTRLGLLNWHPRDMTRFPANELVKFLENLLKRFQLLCHEAESWQGNWYDKRRPGMLCTTLKQIAKWDRDALLATCHIDLLPQVVTDLSDCLDKCTGKNIQSGDFLSHELCRWLIRDEVANIAGGKALLQKLENLWCTECECKYSTSDTRCIAWKGRIELQRVGLATETPAVFQEKLLEAIKNETSGDVRLVLSLWSPGKDTPGRMQRRWKDLWQKGLKSDNEYASRPAALVLLRPDLADDIVRRRQKLRDVLSVLPEHLHPQLSVAEITHLIGEFPLEIWNADPSANPNSANSNLAWQFKPDEMRFRLSAEPVVPVSTPATVQTNCPDRGIQTTRHD